ncbi:MAG: protease modulator HflC [Alphaproteobacteria bacterium]
MNRGIIIGGLVALGIIVVSLFDALYTVRVTHQAIVLQFGDFIRTVREPGLHVKLPFVQNVIYMDKRVLSLDLAPQEVIAADERRLVVDALVRFRIADPLEFYKTVQGSETIGRNRLATTVQSSLRAALAGATFTTLLTEERASLMQEISQQVARQIEPLGMEIIDVRIKRADLPPEISQAVFNRMQRNYNEQAAQRRASGQEEAQRIRANAERERSIIIAEANRDSQITRGEGDSEAVRIFAEAFGRDIDFFEFYRTMQAYQQTIGSEDTLVLSPDSDFFKYLSTFD